MTDKEKYRAMFCDPNWDYETLEAADEVISRIGQEYLKLKTYPNQIEVVTSEQMLDAYSSIGMPLSSTRSHSCCSSCGARRASRPCGPSNHFG